LALDSTTADATMKAIGMLLLLAASAGAQTGTVKAFTGATLIDGTDRAPVPNAIILVRDGALIGAPPFLWYCPDANHDDKADEKIEVARDFGVPIDPMDWPALPRAPTGYCP